MAISKQTQQILDAYAAQVGGKQAPDYTAVIDVIQNTPQLEQALNKAVQAGEVKHIQLDQTLINIGQGAAYNPNNQTITLGDTSNPRELVFQLAHEVQHANYSHHMDGHYKQTYKDMQAIASNTKDPIHDYTPVIDRGLDANRTNEAMAQLAGWNAYVEYQRSQNPNISDQDILYYNPYRSNFSYDGTTIDPQTNRRTQNVHSDISLNPDLSAPMTQPNIEAMGKHFFDTGRGLGQNLNLSYKEYYSSYYLESVASLENHFRPSYRAANQNQAPTVYINMHGLNLSEPRIEADGLSIPGGSMNYVDNSDPQNPQQSQLNGSAPNNVKHNPILHSRNHTQSEPLHVEEASPTQEAAEPKQSTPTGFFDRLVEAAQSGDTAALQPIGQAYLKTKEAQTWLKEAADKLAQEQEAQEQSQQQTNQEQQTQEQEATQQNKAMRM